MTATKPTRRYAAETDVSVARSREEIEATLHRYGATGFGYVTDETIPAAVIVFRLDSRHYRLYVPLPRPDDPAYRRRVNQHAYADTPSPAALAGRRPVHQGDAGGGGQRHCLA